MPKRSTWEEPVEAPAELVPVLSFVLRYEDLLAERAATVPLDLERPFRIGRADEPAEDLAPLPGRLLLDDGWASSHHATLRRNDAGAFFLEDGGSRNGTFVNGERVVGKQRLFDGELIEIGHTLLCFRLASRRQLDALVSDGPARLGPTATRCPEMFSMVGNLQRIARSRQSVLLLGETGVGKEVVARAVHELSGRTGSFGAVDCGAIPETLFEATFFGHRRGAFTGAAEPRSGEIARADQGTLLLDEVGNMSLACQAKLLRAIEESRVVPLGGSEPQEVDVRWIAATNADPFARGATFRPDLIERLGGFVARLPPLRRRREDLGALTAHALRQAGVLRAAISAPAGRALFSGPFPGNVRQLRATIQSAAILADGGPIELGHLPDRRPSGSEERSSAEKDVGGESPRAAVASAPHLAQGGSPDAAAIEAALVQTGGNVIRAAAILDARPRQVYRWIERFELPLDRYRALAERGSTSR